MRLAKGCNRLRSIYRERLRLPAAEAHMDGDSLRTDECGILDEECEHPLAIDRCRAKILPDAREVAGQREDACSGLLIEQTLIGLALPIMLLLKCLDPPKPPVPLVSHRVAPPPLIQITL